MLALSSILYLFDASACFVDCFGVLANNFFVECATCPEGLQHIEQTSFKLGAMS
jgi:hypothetical protein